MRKEYNFITNDDIKRILGDAVDLMWEEAQYDVLPPLQKIEQTCKLYKRLRNKAILVANSFTKEKTTINDKDLFKKTMELGFILVYQLRYFLLKQDIVFDIGSQSPDGKHYGTKEILMSQILEEKKFVVSLSGFNIQLANELENYNNRDKLIYREDLWKQVLNNAQFDNGEWDPNKKYNEEPYVTSKGKKTTIYQNPNSDINIWIRWHKEYGKNIAVYYYKKEDGKYLAYNNGWLFEWFRDFSKDSNNITQLEEAFKNKISSPLEILFKNASRENIEGYKGGDYVKGRKQIQAKFGGNRQIQAFASIDKVILGENGIYDIVQKYNENKVKKELTEKFIQLYTHKDTLNISYSTIVDKILSQLELKNKS